MARYGSWYVSTMAIVCPAPVMPELITVSNPYAPRTLATLSTVAPATAGNAAMATAAVALTMAAARRRQFERDIVNPLELRPSTAPADAGRR